MSTIYGKSIKYNSGSPEASGRTMPLEPSKKFGGFFMSTIYGKLVK
jgi:hypothetical protein